MQWALKYEICIEFKPVIAMHLRILLLMCLINYNLAFNKHSNQKNRTKRWLQLKKIIPQHPDVGVLVPDLIVRYGYKAESHTVSTNDNYILTIHRIPHGKHNSHEKNKPVVFLMHGLLASSADWVLMGPHQGLAYLLADLGYDVWMGNARGNQYSRQHLTMNPDQNPAYWDFSWHEIGYYDLPKMIDTTLEITKMKKLYFIGHSQGCTTFFVMCSLFPEYNNKVFLMFALGPAVFMKHLTSPVIQALVDWRVPAEIILKAMGENEFLPSTDFKKAMSNIFCHKHAITQEICSNMLFLICGFDEEQLNKTMLPVMLGSSPAGSATKQLLHFSQEVISDRFRQYDYGIEGNMRVYGRAEPPDYNLANVMLPVAIIYGQNDLLVATEDVERLSATLPNVVLSYKIPFKKFSHLDFLWANDVVVLLYNIIFQILPIYK